MGEREPEMVQNVIYLGNQRVLVRLAFGGYLVVPTWNVDVGVGLIRDGLIEPWTTAAVKALLSYANTYVNVGANFGYYAVLGAHLVERRGKVFAIEANPHLIPDLVRTTYWAGFPDVIRLFQCAVADESGRTLKLSFDPQFIGGGTVQDWSLAIAASPPIRHFEECFWTADKVALMKGPSHEVNKAIGFMSEIEVVSETLDRILAEVAEVDLLHMDIEGSEPAAILGAREIIRRSPDLAIIMEWSPNYAAAHPNLIRDMFQFLTSEGYRFHLLDPASFDPNAEFPATVPVATLADLMATPHGYLVCLRMKRAQALGLAA